MTPTQFMIHELHPDTEKVMTVLRGVNDQISYEDLARQAELGLERTKQVSHSARRILKRESYLFGVIRGFGLKLLSDAEKSQTGERRKKSIGRSARTGIKDLGTIHHFDRLTKANQHTVVTDRTIFNVINQQSKVRAAEPTRRTAPQPMPNSARLIEANKK